MEGDASKTEKPQPPPFTDEDVACCIKVLNALGRDEETFNSKPMKPLRKALAPLVEIQRRKMFDGLSKDEYLARQNSRKRRKMEDFRKKQDDRKLINSRQMRKARMERLEALTMQGAGDVELEALLVPDGVAGSSLPRAAIMDGEVTVEGERKEESGADSGAEGPIVTVTDPTHPRPKLHNPRSCYTCAAKFTELHHFYDRMCPPCAKLNYGKRYELADLRGRVVIVTGARVKIGTVVL